MTKVERDALVAEAIGWMCEDGGRFPGWEIEPKVDAALLESALTIWPQCRLIEALASMRMHWLPQGATTRAAWRTRLRNWFNPKNVWDVLLTGEAPAPDVHRVPETRGAARVRRAPDRPAGYLEPSRDIVKRLLTEIREKLSG